MQVNIHRFNTTRFDLSIRIKVFARKIRIRYLKGPYARAGMWNKNQRGAKPAEDDHRVPHQITSSNPDWCTITGGYFVRTAGLYRSGKKKLHGTFCEMVSRYLLTNHLSQERANAAGSPPSPAPSACRARAPTVPATERPLQPRHLPETARRGRPAPRRALARRAPGAAPRPPQSRAAAAGERHA